MADYGTRLTQAFFDPLRLVDFHWGISPITITPRSILGPVTGC
jgi:hypothetical protein